MKKAILFAVVLGAGSLCFASDWVSVASPDDGMIYMDFDSIGQVGIYKKAWIKTNHYFPIETVTLPKVKYRSVKSLYYFNCSEKTKLIVQTVGYAGWDGKGEVVFSDATKFSSSQMTDIVPDTVAESFMTAACATPAGRVKIRAQANMRAKETQEFMDRLLKEESGAAQPGPEGR